MANSISGVNPLVFDTAGSTSALTKGQRITSIVWDSGASGAGLRRLRLLREDGRENSLTEGHGELLIKSLHRESGVEDGLRFHHPAAGSTERHVFMHPEDLHH